jgi:hypothetical protein
LGSWYQRAEGEFVPIDADATPAGLAREPLRLARFLPFAPYWRGKLTIASVQVSKI